MLYRLISKTAIISSETWKQSCGIGVMVMTTPEAEYKSHADRKPQKSVLLRSYTGIMR